MKKTIIYIGGYKSGGHKVSILIDKLDCNIVNITPNYDIETPENIQQQIQISIETAIDKGHKVEIIGSSTGGMTALLLFRKYNINMYLINPLLAKEQFFDKNHTTSPILGSIYNTLINTSYTNNNIIIYLGNNDELLNPNFTKEFAKKKGIEVISFEGEHAGTESLYLIIDKIKNT